MDLRRSRRTSSLAVPVDDAWARLTAGGPGRHWYADAPAFRFRAGLDQFIGGTTPVDPPGRTLRAGDRAGFWEVTSARNRTLTLTALVRAPGTVTFTSTLTPEGAGCRLTQEVSFDPDGLLGAAYLLADLPARATLLALVHRRTCRELAAPGR